MSYLLLLAISFLTRILHSSICRNRNSFLKLEVLRIVFALGKYKRKAFLKYEFYKLFPMCILYIFCLERAKTLIVFRLWSATLPGHGHGTWLVLITVCQVQRRLESGLVEAAKHCKPWVSSFWLPWAVLSEEDVSWANVFVVPEHWICSWGRSRPLSKEELLPWWHRPRGTPQALLGFMWPTG